MSFANPVGGVIVQTGTDVGSAGLSGNSGITHTANTHLDVYNFGTNRVRVDGTWTINPNSDGDREQIIIGVDGATQNVDIDISSGGTLIVGSLDSQGGVEFSMEQYWCSIFEDASIDFSDGSGNITGDGGTSDAFINVEGGGRLELYGGINMTGGIRFKGANDGASSDEAEVVIRGGVIDARRLTERSSGESDNFIYNYSDELDIAPPNGDVSGLTILTATTTGASEKGYAIIQLGEPISLKGTRFVFSSQAWGGSGSAGIGLAYEIRNHPGVIGISGIDNMDLRSASVASNTSVIPFINSVKGSNLNLATQNPGFSSIPARQDLSVNAVFEDNTNITDAVAATFGKDYRVIEDDTPASGAFALGEILLADFTPPHSAPTADPPEAEPYGQNCGRNIQPADGAYNPNDKFSVYVWSLLGVNSVLADEELRGLDGTNLIFKIPYDLKVVETSRSTINAYGHMGDMARAFDRSKTFKIDNPQVPVVGFPIVSPAGNTQDYGEFDIVLDGTAGSAYAISMAAANRDTIVAGVAWAESTSITLGADDDFLIVAVANENDPLRHVTSCTYGGISMELLHKVNTTTDFGNTLGIGVEVYALRKVGIDQAVGTTIVVGWDTTPTNNKVYRASYQKVSQIGPLSGLDALTTRISEAVLTQDPYAEDEGLVIGFSLNDSAGTATWEGGATEHLDTTTSGFGFSVASRAPTTDGELSMDVTSTERLIAAIALRPSQGLLTMNPVTSPSIVRVGFSEAVVEDPEASQIVITVPAGVLDEDALVLLLGHPESEDNTWTDHASFNEVIDELQSGGSPSSTPGLSMYEREASSEPASYTIVGSFTSGMVAQLIAWRDVDTGTPLDVTSTTSTGASGNPDPPSITPTNDGSMIVAVMLGDTEQAISAAPSGYSNLQVTTTVDGGDDGDRTGSEQTETFTTPTTGVDWEVPAGVTSIEAKAWGAGGAGGGSDDATGNGGGGGGGGFAHATAISVTPGETLSRRIGGGGTGGTGANGGDTGDGGGGGGYSGLFRGSTPLIIGGGGAGGGGGDNSNGGTGFGGGGGTNTGRIGGDDELGLGGTLPGEGGTQIAGGAAGVSAAETSGLVGASLAGGAGANSGAAAGTGGGGAGGTNGGAAGGDASTAASFAAGGGGGGGFFGGGGGAGSDSGQAGGCGGGGGSNTLTGTTQTNAAGNDGDTGTGTGGSDGVAAGTGDGDYPAGTGDGGAKGLVATPQTGGNGEDGALVLIYTPDGTSLDGCTMASAELKQVTAGAENPGAFTSDESEPWCCATFALRVNQSGGGDIHFDPTAGWVGVKTLRTVFVRNGAGINGADIEATVVQMDDNDTNVSDSEIDADLHFADAGTVAYSNVTVTGDILNNDAAANMIINASNGSSLSTSEPGTGNGQVDIRNTVTLKITVTNDAGSPIENARVRVTATETVGSITSGDVLLTGLTNASGIIQDTAFNYESAFDPSGLDINVRARQGSVSPFKEERDQPATIPGTGLDIVLALSDDE